MNLLMQEDLAIDDGSEICLMGKISELEREYILSKITSRIVLDNEDRQASTWFGSERIPLCEINGLNKQLATNYS